MRTGARLLQPSQSWNGKTPQVIRPPGKEGAQMRTGARLLPPSRTWNGKRNAHRPLGHGRCAKCAPAHACSNQANLRTEKNPQVLRPPGKEGAQMRTGARLLQPSQSWNGKNPASPPPSGQGRCALRTGARLLQPSQSQNGKNPASPPPSGQGRCANAHRRTPAPTKPNLRTEKGTANLSPLGQGRCAPRTGARLLQQSPS